MTTADAKTPSDVQLLSKTRERVLATLDAELSGVDDVILLDFPSHMNVGDSMIWAGEMEALRTLNKRVHYISDAARYDAAALKRSPRRAAILLHGGGNFGNVWPEFQDFRVQVLNDFPNRKIVQLPQTIYYSGRKPDRVDLGPFLRHNDFTLICRDEPSLEWSRQHLVGIRAPFAPDSAYAWTAAPSESPNAGRVVVLLRKDHEAQPGAHLLSAWCRKNIAPSDKVSADWGLTGSDLLQWKLSRIPGALVRRRPALARTSPVAAALRMGYRKMASLNLAAGLSLFSGARAVITDRLHAHVLATLLGIPHVVMDNSYGKIAAVAARHSLDASYAHYAQTPVEAVRMIEGGALS